MPAVEVALLLRERRLAEPQPSPPPLREPPFREFKKKPLPVARERPSAVLQRRLKKSLAPLRDQLEPLRPERPTQLQPRERPFPRVLHQHLRDRKKQQPSPAPEEPSAHLMEQDHVAQYHAPVSAHLQPPLEEVEEPLQARPLQRFLAVLRQLQDRPRELAEVAQKGAAPPPQQPLPPLKPQHFALTNQLPPRHHEVELEALAALDHPVAPPSVVTQSVFFDGMDTEDEIHYRK